MEQIDSITSASTYIGFSEQNNKIWTIEFELTSQPVNKICHLYVQKFKIISIENKNGIICRKDGNYVIGSSYYLRKHPIKVFLDKTNLMFDNFYINHIDTYNTFIGQVTEYYSSGDIFLQYFLNNGTLEGNYVAYNKYGNLIESSFFVSGKRHGKMEYHCIYDDNTEECRIGCIFDMGELQSWDIEFSRNESFSHIYDSMYYDGTTNFDETTRKYSYYGSDYIMEWTKNNGEYDTYSVKCTEEWFKKKYFHYCSDIPYDITHRYR